MTRYGDWTSWSVVNSPVYPFPMHNRILRHGDSGAQTLLNFAFASSGYTITGSTIDAALPATPTAHEADPPANVFSTPGADQLPAGSNGMNATVGLDVSGGAVTARYALVWVDYYLQTRPEALSAAVGIVIDDAPDRFQFINETGPISQNRRAFMDPHAANFAYDTSATQSTAAIALDGTGVWDCGSGATSPNDFEASVTFDVAMFYPQFVVDPTTLTLPAPATYASGSAWNYSRTMWLPRLNMSDYWLSSSWALSGTGATNSEKFGSWLRTFGHRAFTQIPSYAQMQEHGGSVPNPAGAGLKHTFGADALDSDDALARRSGGWERAPSTAGSSWPTHLVITAGPDGGLTQPTYAPDLDHTYSALMVIFPSAMRDSHLITGTGSVTYTLTGLYASSMAYTVRSRGLFDSQIANTVSRSVQFLPYPPVN